MTKPVLKDYKTYSMLHLKQNCMQSFKLTTGLYQSFYDILDSHSLQVETEISLYCIITQK